MRLFNPTKLAQKSRNRLHRLSTDKISLNNEDSRFITHPNCSWILHDFNNKRPHIATNKRDLMKILEGNLNIRHWTDWYKVTFKDIVRLGGGSMIKRYNSSPSTLIMSTFPDHPWNPLKFTRTPKSYWNQHINQKKFMRTLQNQLNIRNWTDWYQVTSKDIIRLGGNSLLNQYNNSPSSLITSIYPDHPWDILKFTRVPYHYWDKQNNQREFMKLLENKLNIVDWEDWYRVGAKEIMSLGGSGLLQYYNGSPSNLIMSMYPNHPWNLLEFIQTPKSYWKDPSNQQKFLELLENQLGVKQYSDWYHISNEELIKLGGGSLLSIYGGSLWKLVLSVYPQHPWNVFEFRTKNMPWDSQLAQDFLKKVASQLHISTPQAWLTLSYVQLKNFQGGHSLLKQTESLQGALKLAFPSVNWSFISTTKISKPQNRIVDSLAAYIPREHMIINFRHPSLVHESGRVAEIDVWIPSLNLGIEYHGEHHYHQLWERSQNPSIRKERDAEKRRLCSENGIHLVEVQYWWDQSDEKLIASIRSVLPKFLDHVEKFEKTIPSSLPETSRSNHWNSFTLPLSLAMEYNNTNIVDGWNISEKLDGVRCHWDGLDIFSRGHHHIDLLEIQAIATLLDNLIDGELWYERGMRFGIGAVNKPSFVAFDLFDQKNVK